jgi:hypothetical protein
MGQIHRDVVELKNRRRSGLRYSISELLDKSWQDGSSN